MRVNRRFLREILCALVAVAFAIAVQPGAMAMPDGHMAAHTVAAAAAHAAMSECPMAQSGKQGLPAKQAPPCLGMLVCYGMAVLAAHYPAFKGVSAPVLRMPHSQAAVSGLTITPDSPPPIA